MGWRGSRDVPSVARHRMCRIYNPGVLVARNVAIRARLFSKTLLFSDGVAMVTLYKTLLG